MILKRLMKQFLRQMHLLMLTQRLLEFDPDCDSETEALDG